MRRIDAGDVLSVVEAAYRVEEPETEWLGGLAMAALPLLDQGFGAIAFTVDLSKEFELTGSFATDPRVSMMETFGSARSFPLALIRSFYRGKQGRTASQHLARTAHGEEIRTSWLAGGCPRCSVRPPSILRWLASAS